MEFYNYIRYFTVYLLFCMILLNVPIEISLGAKQNIMVAVFYISFVTLSYIRKYKKWINILQYLFPVSIFFIIPDWFLSDRLGVLAFPIKSNINIGTVPSYLIGMWSISLFLLLYSSLTFYEKNKDIFKRNLLIIGLSFFIFILSDETLWQLSLWHYKDVKAYGHLPYFMLLPNLLIGLHVYYAYEFVSKKSIFYKILAAFLTMLIRFGLIAGSYYIVEVLL